MQKVVIVVPVYRTELTWYEKISLARLYAVLPHYPIVFVSPEGLALPEAVMQGHPVMAFSREFFTSVAAYSRLLLSQQFYAHFQDFEYMLIYQLDAFVFVDLLQEFCSLGYDYIGGPWQLQNSLQKVRPGKYKIYHVGNGGLSLRRIEACLRLLAKCQGNPRYEGWGEDTFWGIAGHEDRAFRLAPLRIAYAFSIDTLAERCYRKNGNQLPFGCHGWPRFSRDFYLQAMAACGLDLSARYDDMQEHDKDDEVLYWQQQTVKRLLLHVAKGWAVSGCLPEALDAGAVKCWVVGKDSLSLCDKLRQECGENTFKNVFYDYEDGAGFLRDFRRECGAGIRAEDNLLVSWRSEEIVQSCKSVGLIYGRDYVSFYHCFKEAQGRILRAIMSGGMKRG
ncbi:DUF5672 family protein [Selenomonas sp. KH1T6]|uniref:DUF5672 family protein n=1 Tax=Selenomonas sp. KH1T6 TaxID=3158784 RepID=UPI0008A7E5A0|nr:hypothetical protein SAMN05216583_104144 [Selenomonas ruminantium]